MRLYAQLTLVLTSLLICTGTVIADQNRIATSYEVPREDMVQAQALANQLVALSPKVNPEEARQFADCAYATVSQLRRQYRMFGTPIFNNFLVYHGLKKRGYCYQWAEDLLVALDQMKLTSLELHWAESHPHDWRENNCLVVTARGQPFNRGIVLDCWRHFGHLRWNAVLSDQDPYVENNKYARFVRARAAQKSSSINHHVAFESAVKTN